MSDNTDSVYVDPQGASNALHLWDTTTSTFVGKWDAAIQKINEVHGKAPWGEDEPGQAYREAYTGHDFTSQENVKAPYQQISQIGSKARTAIEKSIGSDVDQEAAVHEVKFPGTQS